MSGKLLWTAGIAAVLAKLECFKEGRFPLSPRRTGKKRETMPGHQQKNSIRLSAPAWMTPGKKTKQAMGGEFPWASRKENKVLNQASGHNEQVVCHERGKEERGTRGQHNLGSPTLSPHERRGGVSLRGQARGGRGTTSASKVPGGGKKNKASSLPCQLLTTSY